MDESMNDKNFYYRKVEYLNAKGHFVDNNTIKAVAQNGKERILTADNIVIATGMRPKYPEVST